MRGGTFQVGRSGVPPQPRRAQLNPRPMWHQGPAAPWLEQNPNIRVFGDGPSLK